MQKKFLILFIALFVLSDLHTQAKHSHSSRFKSYKGLIMAGYPRWHNTPEDGTGWGWGHYLFRDQFGPVCLNN